MKKIFALAMSAALILSGCSSNAPTNPAVSGSSVSTASQAFCQGGFLKLQKTGKHL